MLECGLTTHSMVLLQRAFTSSPVAPFSDWASVRERSLEADSDRSYSSTVKAVSQPEKDSRTGKVTP